MTLRMPKVSLLLLCPVAGHYISDLQGFKDTAAQWTRMYASKEARQCDAIVVQKLVDMGFDQTVVKKALIANNGQEREALEAILTGEIY